MGREVEKERRGERSAERKRGERERERSEERETGRNSPMEQVLNAPLTPRSTDPRVSFFS